MLTRNKKLKDYGIPAEDIEKLNTMLKDFPAEYGYRRKTVAVLYERMRLLGVWEDK